MRQSLAETAIRSIIRAAAWRAIGAVPVWVAFAILAIVIVFGGRI